MAAQLDMDITAQLQGNRLEQPIETLPEWDSTISDSELVKAVGKATGEARGGTATQVFIPIFNNCSNCTISITLNK